MVIEWCVNGMYRVKEGLTRTVGKEWLSCGRKNKGLEIHLPPPPPFSRPRNEVTTLKQRREEGRGSESMRERERAKD